MLEGKFDHYYMYFIIEALAANLMPLIFTILGSGAMYLKALIFKGEKVGPTAIFYIVLFRLYPALMYYPISFLVCVKLYPDSDKTYMIANSELEC